MIINNFYSNDIDDKLFEVKTDNTNNKTKQTTNLFKLALKKKFYYLTNKKKNTENSKNQDLNKKSAKKSFFIDNKLDCHVYCFGQQNIFYISYNMLNDLKFVKNDNSNFITGGEISFQTAGKILKCTLGLFNEKFSFGLNFCEFITLGNGFGLWNNILINKNQRLLIVNSLFEHYILNKCDIFNNYILNDEKLRLAVHLDTDLITLALRVALEKQINFFFDVYIFSQKPNDELLNDKNFLVFSIGYYKKIILNGLFYNNYCNIYLNYDDNNNSMNVLINLLYFLCVILDYKQSKNLKIYLYILNVFHIFGLNIQYKISNFVFCFLIGYNKELIIKITLGLNFNLDLSSKVQKNLWNQGR